MSATLMRWGIHDCALSLLFLWLTGFHDRFIKELDIFDAIVWMGIIAIIVGRRKQLSTNGQISIKIPIITDPITPIFFSLIG